MTPFTTLTAVAAPLLRDNIDTDAIIPSREMKSVSKTGLADGLFAGWRYTAIGGREPDPAFILNQPAFANAQIILGGANFGCGSSREHAVWALHEYGIRAVVAPSFSPIFRGNCVRNGLLPVVLPADAVAALADAADHVVTIDLPEQTVSAGSRRYAFDIDAEAREMLLEGLDAIDLSLKKREAIADWTARDRVARPWIYLEAQA
ncbi:MAG: 3-isopropylmalate dehydratase small subunit [Sphingomonadaceae bacterium]|nr:3-isopropylmalate dehydratase small subunit [Sphingomonadaceae bacterium]